MPRDTYGAAQHPDRSGQQACWYGQQQQVAAQLEPVSPGQPLVATQQLCWSEHVAGSSSSPPGQLEMPLQTTDAAMQLPSPHWNSHPGGSVVVVVVSEQVQSSWHRPGQLGHSPIRRGHGMPSCSAWKFNVVIAVAAAITALHVKPHCPRPQQTAASTKKFASQPSVWLDHVQSRRTHSDTSICP